MALLNLHMIVYCQDSSLNRSAQRAPTSKENSAKFNYTFDRCLMNMSGDVLFAN
ncbi:hypothetical protein Plhal304r1_c008g0033341 [Plasmopara halstedii]